MHLVVLPTLLHGGEVHSVDANCTNTKIVTAGKDGSLSIWSLLELKNLNSKLSIDNVKPLYTFKYHDCLISLAKWSPSDPNTLISCDDNGNLYINNFTEGKQTYSDNHKLIYPILEADFSSSTFVDGSWSNNGKLFAWSTANGKIHIYDTIKHTYQELTTLDHSEKSLIQRSVAFDPTNNFLVSLGDDTLIYLYQFQEDSASGNYQFRLIHKISKLINKTPLNVKYKRISWSPDGEFIPVPTASKNQTSLISLISRSQHWTNKVSLVGHDLNCEVVKFNPKTYTTAVDEVKVKNEAINYLNRAPQIEKSQQIDKQDENLFQIIATAGSDKTLVVWNTSKDSPIFVIKDIVSRPIVDLCWDKTGDTLLLATLDGLLVVVKFEKSELGNEIKEDVYKELKEFESKFVKPFNFKYDGEGLSSKRSSNQQIDILDQKDAVAVFENQKSELDTDSNNNLVVDQKNTLVDTTNAKHGSIIPKIIEPSILDDPASQTDDILESSMSNRQVKASAKSTIKTKQTVRSDPDRKAATDISTQKTSTKNGKRRIQPMLLSGNDKEPSIQDTFSKPANKSANGSTCLSNSTPKSTMEFDKPSYLVSDEVVKEKKRIKGNPEDSNTKRPIRDLEPVKFVGSMIINPNISFAKVRLSVPKVRFNFRVISKNDDNLGKDCLFVLDVKNGQGNESVPTRITYFKKDKQIWCDFIPRYIQLAVEGSNFWALSTADGQILTYSHTSGKRLLPPMILGTPLSFLESKGKYLMAVTSVAELFVWDLERKKLHLQSPLSLSSLLDLSNKFQDDGLSKSENLTMCSITSSGIPLVTLSNGTGYLFNKDLGTWQTVTESWWAFGSHYWNSLGSDDSSSKSQASNVLGGDESSIVGLLEHKTNEEILRKTRAGRGKFFNKISKNMIMKEGFENLENTISLSHLENRILCCEALGESKDFKKDLITYAERVCELGLKAKLFDICSQLLGPYADSEDEEESDINNRVDKQNWQSKVCGLDKHELLKEIILACAVNRDAQRILIHFGKKIGVLDDFA